MARRARSRTALRSLFAATLLVAPLLAEAAVPGEGYRAVRELRIKAPSRPKLSRVLEKIEKNRKLVDEDVQKRKLTAGGARKRLKDLAAIADKTLALAPNGRDLSEARMETLDWELDQIHGAPSPKKEPRQEHRSLVAANRRGACSSDGDSYDCLKTWDTR